MIPYIQPIFVPNENAFNRNRDSIISFGEYIKKYECKVQCVFGGWAYNDEWWEKICEVIRENISDDVLIELIRYEKNFGKAYVVNDLYKKIKKLKFDFFLTTDSDIKFPLGAPNLFAKLAKVGREFQKIVKKKFGFVALNQLENNCHLTKRLNKVYNVGTQKLVAAKQPGFIAGGCLFISKKAWEQVEGYRVTSVYGGQDGHLLIDIKKAGYECVMSPDISIIHPGEKDKVLINFKPIMQKFKKKGNLDEMITMVDKFWDKRNNKHD